MLDAAHLLEWGGRGEGRPLVELFARSDVLSRKGALGQRDNFTGKATNRRSWEIFEVNALPLRRWSRGRFARRYQLWSARKKTLRYFISNVLARSCARRLRHISGSVDTLL